MENPNMKWMMKYVPLFWETSKQQFEWDMMSFGIGPMIPKKTYMIQGQDMDEICQFFPCV